MRRAPSPLLWVLLPGLPVHQGARLSSPSRLNPRLRRAFLGLDVKLSDPGLSCRDLHSRVWALRGRYRARLALHQVRNRAFQLARTDGRLRIELITARQYGLVGFAPANFSQFRLQWSLLVIAGPLASFAGGVIFILLSERAPSADYFWICICNAQLAVLGMMQLIPFTAGGGGSDGFKLLPAIRGGPSMDAAAAATLIYASRLNPLRPRDWPRDLLLRLVAPQNETQAQVQARRLYSYLAYVHFLDAGEIELADRYLDQLMARWTPSDTPEFAFEAACFRARYRNNPEGARNWLTLEKRNLKAQPWMRFRAEAAIECAANNISAGAPHHRPGSLRPRGRTTLWRAPI